VMTQASLLEVIDGGAVVIDKHLRSEILPADRVISAVGLEPEQGIYRSLKSRSANLYLIGDAREAKDIMNAVWDAYEVARVL
jgi:2-enoate reductase